MAVQFTFAGETVLYDGIGEPAPAEALAWVKHRWPVQLAPLGDQHIRVRIVRELGEDAICYEVSIRDAPPAVQAPPIIADERLPFSTVLLNLAVQAQVNTEAKRDPLQHALVHVTQLKADDIAGHQACEERKEPYIVEHPLLGINIQLRDILSYTSGPPRLAHWRCLGGCRKRHGGINYHGCGIIGDPSYFPLPLRTQFERARKKFIRKLGQHFSKSKAPDDPKAPEVAEEAVHLSDGDGGDDGAEVDAMQPEAAAPAAAANARALRQVPRPAVAPLAVDAGAAAGANRPLPPRNPAPAAPAAVAPINPMPLAGGGRVVHDVDANPVANPVIAPPPVADQDVLMVDADPALNGAARQAEAAAVAAAAMPRVQVHRPAPARRAVNAGAAAGANHLPPPVVNGAGGGGDNHLPDALAQLQRQAVPDAAAAVAAASPAEIEAATAQLREDIVTWRKADQPEVRGRVELVNEALTDIGTTMAKIPAPFNVIASYCEQAEFLKLVDTGSLKVHVASSLEDFENNTSKEYRKNPIKWYQHLRPDRVNLEPRKRRAPAPAPAPAAAAAAAEGDEGPAAKKHRVSGKMPGTLNRKAVAGGGGGGVASVKEARSSKKKNQQQQQAQAAAQAQQDDTEDD